MTSDNIKVCCRFRKDPDSEELDDWEFNHEIKQIKLRDKTFNFDEIMDMNTTQDEMYNKVAAKTVNDFTNGYHGTIFAYGNSGSGKTYSIVGSENIIDSLMLNVSKVPENDHKLFGIIPRATLEIFSAINEYVSRGGSASLKASYIEIYNESITCLLNGKENLKIHEIPKVGFNITGKEERACMTPEDIFKVVYIGSKNKTIAGTKQNALSSRSHTLLSLELSIKTIDGSERTSKLNIVDLAGSEKMRNTGTGINDPERLKEAQKINLSLTTLGMCIMALSENASFVPFRNSKLTLLLKESLGGNSKTTLLCAARRDKKLADDNLNSLYFAQRAKIIKNKVTKNIKLSEKESEYLISALKNEIVNMRRQYKDYGAVLKPISDPKLIELFSDEFDNALSGNNSLNALLGSNKDGKPALRNSLVNLTEDEIIMKYCNLRAKYDNLLESATNKIYDLKTSEESEKYNLGEFESLKLKHQTEISQLNSEFNSLKDLIIIKEGIYTKEKSLYNSEVAKLTQEIKDMQDIIDLNGIDIEGLTNQISDLEAEIKKMKSEKDDLNLEITQRNEQRISMEKYLKDLEETEKVTMSKLIEKENECIKLLNENSELNVKVKEISEKLNEMNNLKSIYEQKLLDSERENTEKTLLNEAKQIETNNKIMNLEATLSLKENTIESLTTELDNLKQLQVNKISENELLSQKEKLYEQRKSFLEEKISSLNDINAKINNELIELNKIKNEEIATLQLMVNKLTNENNQLSSDLKISNENNETLKTLKDDIIQNKVNEISLLREEIDKKSSSFHLSTNELNEKINSQAKEINKLNQQINDQEETIARQNKENEKALQGKNNEIAELKSLLQQLNEKIKLMGQEKDDLININKDLEKNNLELSGKINSLNQETTTQREKLTQMRLSIDNTRQSPTADSKIKKKVDFKIFGITLLKNNTKFLEIEKEAEKYKKKWVENLNKDKLDELNSIRENIESMTPKTVSEHDSDLEICAELDFNDAEAFKKTQEKMEQKEKERSLRKLNLKDIIIKKKKD